MKYSLEAAGRPIGPYDMQVAAIALAHGLFVVNHNMREFGRVPGLQIEDWEVSHVPPQNDFLLPFLSILGEYHRCKP